MPDGQKSSREGPQRGGEVRGRALNACCVKQQRRTSQGSPLNTNCQRPEKGPRSTPTSFPEYLVPPGSLLFKQSCYPHARFSLGQNCQRLEKEKENPKSTKKKKKKKNKNKKPNSTKSCICGRHVPCTPGTTRFPTIQTAISTSRQVPTGARLQETRKTPTSAISPAPEAAVSPAYLGLPRSL